MATKLDIGDYSIKDKEPKYGLVVTGQVNENRMWTNSRAKPGDKILFKGSRGMAMEKVIKGVFAD